MKVLVDGNSLTYAYHNGSKLSAGGVQTQAIFGMMNAVRELCVAHRVRPIVLWDSKVNWREKACDEYKANRDKDPKMQVMREEVREVRPRVRQALNSMGISQIIVKGLEADDLAGYFSVGYSSQGEDVLLISGDKDWIQLVNGKCSWHDPIRDRTVSRMNFKEFTGVETPQEYVEMKALMGDASDNLKGVPGIGEKCAIAIFDYYESVDGMIKELYNTGEVPGSLSKWRKKLLDFAMSSERLAIYRRNLDLMDLRKIDLNNYPERKHIRGSYSRELLQEVCDRYAFASITRRFDVWVKPLEAT